VAAVDCVAELDEEMAIIKKVMSSLPVLRYILDLAQTIYYIIAF